MQWYVYLVTISAAVFLSQIAAELVKRPILTILRIRRLALGRMIAFSKTSLPRPREMAISSLDIREYDQAVRNTKDAQRTFRDLGVRLLLLSETEAAIRTMMRLLGLDIERAGQELIHLSELYATATTDSERLRREIAKSVLSTCAALAAYRDRSRDDLVKLQLEPMDLLRPEYSDQRSRVRPIRGMTPA
ncbi:MAG: hypothetical protein K2X57_04945 [Xanthobacteraceae bacterium]|nr:hypothetical protein [Xanthobacteraceae bacterium]